MLDLEHRALAGLINAIRRLRDHAVESRAFEAVEPFRRDAPIFGHRSQVDGRLDAGQQLLEQSPALALRRAAVIAAVAGQQIKADERRRGLLGELGHAGRGGVKSQLQRIEVETVRCRNHDLAIEHAAVRKRAEKHVVQLGKVAVERAQVPTLDEHLAHPAKDERAESIPLGFEQEPRARGQLIGQGRKHRFNWRLNHRVMFSDQGAPPPTSLVATIGELDMTFAVEIAPPFLVQAVAIVGAAALVAYISQRLGLVPIVGFLIAGIVISPRALKLVDDQALVNASAEIGVILLLFTIGIEFSLEKLARIKALIFGGGGLQVSLASLCVLGVLAFLGVEWRAALFTGFLVSLSSTAIVLKLLSDRGETASTSGQVTLGLLIFQDLAVIVMVLVVPMLGSGGGSGVGILWALGKALALILAVLLIARRFMPRLLENVALTCSPELFLLTVVAVCFGTAWLTSTVGVSLSLGAFLAGLMVSESRFSHHAFGEIMPLQILFSATFFVSVGMLLDVGFLLRHLPLVLAAVALVLVLKAVTTATSVLCSVMEDRSLPQPR